MAGIPIFVIERSCGDLSHYAPIGASGFFDEDFLIEEQ
jgi:hypothetical protein